MKNKEKTGARIHGAVDYRGLAALNIHGCMLCDGTDLFRIGIYEPHIQNKKQSIRQFLYGLCEPCFNLPNKALLVEDKIRRSYPHSFIGLVRQEDK